MTRKQVYELIDGERDYQNTDPHDVGHKDSLRSIADWLIYIEHHLAIAKVRVYGPNEELALNEVRKITALGVACMEHNETRPREEN
jgi:hypothetical protein